jgi:hypothetical protein
MPRPLQLKYVFNLPTHPLDTQLDSWKQARHSWAIHFLRNRSARSMSPLRLPLVHWKRSPCCARAVHIWVYVCICVWHLVKPTHSCVPWSCQHMRSPLYKDTHLCLCGVYLWVCVCVSVCVCVCPDQANTSPSPCNSWVHIVSRDSDKKKKILRQWTAPPTTF